MLITANFYFDFAGVNRLNTFMNVLKQIASRDAPRLRFVLLGLQDGKNEIISIIEKIEIIFAIDYKDYKDYKQVGCIIDLEKHYLRQRKKNISNLIDSTHRLTLKNYKDMQE